MGDEGYPLYAATDLMVEPGFWGAHLSVADDPADQVEWAAMFGVQAGDIGESYERLGDTERWPVFRVDLPRRAVLRVIYFNSDPDCGTGFQLSHPSGPMHFVLAMLDGHPRWPGLSWDELCWIAGHPPPGSRWITEWERRLLLFLPCMSDAGMPDTAVDTVARALELVGAAQPARLATRLLDGARSCSWSYDPDGALVCDAQHTGRSPAPPGGLTPRGARAVTRMLAGPPAPEPREGQGIHPLAERYPSVWHRLGTAAFGGGPIEDEIADYARGVDGPDILCELVDEIRRLLADNEVREEDLQSFVQANARQLTSGNGRRALHEIAERLEIIVRRPLPPHPLTRCAERLCRLLELTCSSRELDELVHAGAESLGFFAVRTSIREAQALLADRSITDAELTKFVGSRSWWLVDGSGRRTLQQIVAGLQQWLHEYSERPAWLR